MKNNRVNDARVISGLIREALFLNRSIILNSIQIHADCRLLGLQETDTRVRSLTRTITLETIGVSVAHMVGTELSFELHFPHFLCIWTSRLEAFENGVATISFPKYVDLKNLRQSLRRALGDFHDKTAQVLVQSRGFHFEAHFELTDISDASVGGRLVVDPKLPINKGASLTGWVSFGLTQIQISGTIVRAAIDQEYAEATIYTVGITKDNKENTEGQSKERRKNRREAGSFEMSLRSPLNPGRLIQVKVQNVSIAGFLVTICEPDDFQLLPLGLEVMLDQTYLVAKVIDIRKSSIGLQFVKGDDQSMVWWLKKISSYLAPASTSINASDSEELMRIFFQSGALGAKFAKSNNRFSHKMVRGLEFESLRQPWVHRWIQKDTNGQSKGHVSALKMGDNLWVIGDVVGSPAADQKISTILIPKFLESFRDFSMQSSPNPLHFVCWKKGHAAWTSLEAKLKRAASNKLAGQLEVLYFRLRADPILPSLDGSLIQEIYPTDFLKIKSIRNQVIDEACFDLLQGLDFNFMTFGSPRLSQTFAINSLRWKRAYWTIENENFGRWLAVFSTLPLQASPNQLVESAWLFPINDLKLNKENSATLIALARRVSLQCGLTAPNVRIVLPTHAQGNFGQDATLTGFVGSPQMWEEF